MVNILQEYEDWISETSRAQSGEIDFGVWWTLTGNEREFPRWRLSWIKATGELYACQAAKDRYIKLGVIPERVQVEVILKGWADSDSEIYHNLQALAKRIKEQT